MTRPALAATGAWLTLMALTAASYAVGVLGLGGGVVVAAILAATLCKGQIVADRFMELRHVSWRWRAVVSVYLAVVVALIGLAYGLSAGA